MPSYAFAFAVFNVLNENGQSDLLEYFGQTTKRLAEYLGAETSAPTILILPELEANVMDGHEMIFVREEFYDIGSDLARYNFYRDFGAKVSYQYFGVTVSPKKCADFWIIDGLNEFLKYKTVGRAAEYMFVETTQRVMREDVWMHSFEERLGPNQQKGKNSESSYEN